MTMHGSRTSHSRSSKPPSTPMPIPCPCCKPCPALASFSASCCSTKSIRWTASQACKTASHTRAWSNVRKHPPANAWGRPARKAGTLTSQGPFPKRPRCSYVTTLRASRCWPAWRKNLTKAKPSLCSRITSHGRSLTCSSARPPLIGPCSFVPKGAERVSLAPHWTTQGRSLERAHGMSSLRCVFERPSVPRPFIPEPCPLMGHPLWLCARWRGSHQACVCCPSPEPDTHWRVQDAQPAFGIGRSEGTTFLLGRRGYPHGCSALGTKVTTEPQDVFGAATPGWHRAWKASEHTRPTVDCARPWKAEKNENCPLIGGVCLLTKGVLIRVRRGDGQGVAPPCLPDGI